MSKISQLRNRIEELNNQHLKIISPLMDELSELEDAAIAIEIKKNYYKKLSNEEIKLVVNPIC